MYIHGTRPGYPGTTRPPGSRLPPGPGHSCRAAINGGSLGMHTRARVPGYPAGPGVRGYAGTRMWPGVDRVYWKLRTRPTQAQALRA
eukprot:3560598-Rhodomonas_salina.1